MRPCDDNSAWMKSFWKMATPLLSPHGKTTMSPALFDLQLADGAWAITVSTPHQIQVARGFGVQADLPGQPTYWTAGDRLRDRRTGGRSGFRIPVPRRLAGRMSTRSPTRPAKRKLDRPLQVLVELGYAGGRTGCRSVDEALDACRSCPSDQRRACSQRHRGIRRPVSKGADNAATLKLVENFLDRMVALARRCDARDLFSARPIILSAGGSAFYDVVVERLGAADVTAAANGAGPLRLLHHA